jgi:hypothetical protein
MPDVTPPQPRLLSGWLDPGECFFHSTGLDLRVLGTFAGEKATLRLYLLDPQHTHVAEVGNDQITTLYGTWIDLYGTFQPSPIDHTDCDRHHTGYLTVTALRFSHRPAAKPRRADHPAYKTITACFTPLQPQLADTSDSIMGVSRRG